MVKNTFFSALFILVLGVYSVNAQYTEVINSNKPGFSESPYSVGSGVYQFESNFFYRNTGVNPTFTRPESFGFDLLFRTSFLSEKLELNTQINYQRDKIAFNNIFTSSYYTTGIERFVVGAKYLVYQQKYEDKSKEVRSWKRRMAFDYKRLIPSVAIYAGANTDFINEVYQIGTISPKVGVLLQNNLSNQFNVITNFFYDKIGTDFKEYILIVTGTINFDYRWSGFFENQTIFNEQRRNVTLGTGLAYLFNPNLQLNASGRYILEGNTRGFYTSLGVSYRINKHQDSYYEIDEFGNRIKETPLERYNRKEQGFFKRLFSIFRSNKKRKT